MHIDDHRHLKTEGTPDLCLTGEMKKASDYTKNKGSSLGYSVAKNGKRTKRILWRVLPWVILTVVPSGLVCLLFRYADRYVTFSRSEAFLVSCIILGVSVLAGYVKFRADRIENLLKQDRNA